VGAILHRYATDVRLKASQQITKAVMWRSRKIEQNLTLSCDSMWLPRGRRKKLATGQRVRDLSLFLGAPCC